MVLLELGKKIQNALNGLGKSTVVNEQVLKECLNKITIALLQSDVSVKYIKPMTDSIKRQFSLSKETGANLERVIRQAVVQELTNLLETEKKPLQLKRGKTQVVMFVGLQGSGKTTTCTKYAYYWARKNFKVALICADTFRAGAFDQLKQNATKIRVPFYGSYTETDPVKIAEEGVEIFKKEGFDLIIVDTSGRHKQEGALFEEMQQIEKVVNPDEAIFVMDSSIGQACYSQALAFRKAVRVGSVIVTKLDGHAKGGGALSAVSATQSPIIFIGTGEHFQDFEKFNARSFIKRLLGLGDLEGMVDLVKEAVSEEDQKKMMERIQEGQFDFNDLRSQFQSVLKLGPINQFASMIPGLGQQLMGGGNDKQNIEKVKKQICMLDSMTNKELQCIVQIDDSRKKRICRGSGTQIIELDMMLTNFKQIKKMVTKFSKMNFGGDNIKDMMRNPKMLQSKLASVMDPRALNQMGGMDNIMKMMKDLGSMEKNGQLTDFNNMFNNMKKKKGKK